MNIFPCLSRRFLVLFALFVIALAPAHAATDGKAVAAEIVARGDAALASYRPEQPLATASEFSSLYFDVFEGKGMELELGIRAPGLKTELEVLFGAVNGQAMRGAPPTELRANWQKLRDKLDEAGRLYDEPEASGFVPMLLKAVLILVREGIEAMLVVGALAAYLRRAGGGDRLWVLYAGVGAAIVLSLLVGWGLTGILQTLATSRAVIEGAALLLAAAVLFYVSFWLFSKREAARWQAWVAGQIDSALSRGSLLALAAAAFLAVFREGAETVLFYHALAASQPGQGSALAAGVGLGAAILVLVYLVYRHAALRLPYRLFFGVTAALLYGMAVVFLGQGIVELQAAGVAPSTPLAGVPQVGWLGLAPTLQGVGAQSALLALPLVAWLLVRRTTPVSRPAAG